MVGKFYDEVVEMNRCVFAFNFALVLCLIDVIFLFFGQSLMSFDAYGVLGLDIINFAVSAIIVFVISSIVYYPFYWFHGVLPNWLSDHIKDGFEQFFCVIFLFIYSSTLVKFTWFWGQPYFRGDFFTVILLTFLMSVVFVFLLYDYIPVFRRYYTTIVLVILLTLSPLITLKASGGSSSNHGNPVPTEQQEISDYHNVILLVVETLHAEHLSLIGDHKNSPNLAELANESYVFKNAFSPTSWTLPVISSIQSGRYPQSHGTFLKNRKLPRDITTLSEHLNNSGYATFAVSGQTFFSPKYNFDQGYQTFREVFGTSVLSDSNFARIIKKMNSFIPVRSLKISPATYFSRGQTDAEEINRISKSLLREQMGDSEPFFLTHHYMEPHAPYDPPKQFMQKNDIESVSDPWFNRYRRQGKKEGMYPFENMSKAPPRVVDQMLELYDAEIRYWDQEIGKFIKFLKDHNQYKNSLIIVASDHGEQFYQHNRWGHGESVFNEEIHVPLIIKPPHSSFENSEKITAPVSLVDVPATILNSIDTSREQFNQSTSLLDWREKPNINSKRLQSEYRSLKSGLSGTDTAVYSNLTWPEQELESSAIVQNGWKLIRVQQRNRTEKLLFDLTSDFSEKNNIAERYPDKVDELQERLRKWEQRMKQESITASNVELTGKLRNQLKGMGYIK